MSEIVTNPRYFKVLAEDGSACHGGSGSWHLPTGDKPGKWMPKIKGQLALCVNGYHVFEFRHIISRAGPALYPVEMRGDFIAGDSKDVTREARLLPRIEGWNASTMRLWLADCYERLLPIFEASNPDDKRPHQHIEAARRHVRGEISLAKLDTAAWAAWAAWAARDARDAYQTQYNEAAAREESWQLRRLAEYLGIEILTAAELISAPSLEAAQ